MVDTKAGMIELLEHESLIGRIDDITHMGTIYIKTKYVDDRFEDVKCYM